MIDFNPIFDKETKDFPLLSQIKISLYNIGIDNEKGKEIPTIKTAINEALRNMIGKLKSLDLEALDAEVTKFDFRLEKARKDAIRNAISKKILLPYYPQPKDIYVD